MPDPADIKEFARPRAEVADLDWPTFERQIQTESGWRHWSAPGVVKSSPTGSMGLGQLNSRFYPESDWRDPYTNISKAIEIVSGYLRRFGSYRKALAAYNWGPGNVGGYTDAAGRVHPAWDGSREWRCPHEAAVAQCRTAQRDRYLDAILGPEWPEPGAAPEPAPPPAPPGGQTVPEYQFGFKALADMLGRDVVGTPTTDEQPWRPDDLTVQYTDRGLMLYHQPTNRPYFIPGHSTGPVGALAPPTSLVDVRGTLPTRPGASPYPRRDLSAVDSIDVHYTASPSSGTVEAIAAYQVGPSSHEAFPAIAYHLVVDGSGAVYLCHDLDRRVWHNGAPGRNERAVGLCYIGDREPNAAQMRGLREAVRWCEQQLGRSLTVSGHKDSYATACPGPSWPSWRSAILA